MVSINNMVKRGVVVILCLCIAPFAYSYNSENNQKTVTKAEVVTLTDLQQVNTMSKTNCLPIVIMVSQFSCAYCDKLKKFVFIPIIKSGEFAEKAIIRELLIDPNEVILDENGAEILGMNFARRYIDNILTPTVLILDSNGNEQATRTIGIGNIDFYGSYFEQSLAEVNTKMKTKCHLSLSNDESAASKREKN